MVGFPRTTRLALSLIVAMLCCARFLLADGPLDANSTSSQTAGTGGDEEHPSYGPPADVPRKTLFQWSYGTSFSGGPELDKPLETDRPDYTQSSVDVGRGVLQIESGYTYTASGHGDAQTTSHSFPETLFRYGIFADWLELRVEPNYLVEKSESGWNSGAADTYLGAKIALTPQERWLPEMAILIEGTVPTGSKAFTAGRVLPDVSWAYSWDVSEFFSIAGNTVFGLAVDDNSDRTYTQWTQTCSLGYQLTKKLHAYTECYGLFPQGADTELPQYYFDCGFSHLLNDNLQWDIRAGIGLNEAADDYYFGSGLSIRIR